MTLIDLSENFMLLHIKLCMCMCVTSARTALKENISPLELLQFLIDIYIHELASLELVRDSCCIER